MLPLCGSVWADWGVTGSLEPVACEGEAEPAGAVVCALEAGACAAGSDGSVSAAAGVTAGRATGVWAFGLEGVAGVCACRDRKLSPEKSAPL